MRTDVLEDDPRILGTDKAVTSQVGTLVKLSDDLCHQGPYCNSTCRAGKVNLPDVCNRDEVP